jgi:transcriptional regulator with XRE-family HTH domain
VTRQSSSAGIGLATRRSPTTKLSPTMGRRRLGMKLRGLRKAAGFTLDPVAARLGWSDSKVSRIETGQVAATTRDVIRLLDLYGVSEGQRQKLIKDAWKAQEKAWWEAYSDTLVVPLVGLEEAAASIRIYEAMAVPGLFQTGEYAQTIIRSARPELSEDQVERCVDLRMARRQFLFSREDAPELTAVIDEAVLRRPIGGSEAMGRQLQYLAESARIPTVTLRILPFEAGVHPAMNGAFTIFGFNDSLDPDVVYLEHIKDDLYLEKPHEVQRYARAFEQVLSLSLSPSDSISRLDALVDNC